MCSVSCFFIDIWKQSFWLAFFIRVLYLYNTSSQKCSTMSSSLLIYYLFVELQWSWAGVVVLILSVHTVNLRVCFSCIHRRDANLCRPSLWSRQVAEVLYVCVAKNSCRLVSTYVCPPFPWSMPTPWSTGLRLLDAVTFSVSLMHSKRSAWLFTAQSSVTSVSSDLKALYKSVIIIIIIIITVALPAVFLQDKWMCFNSCRLIVVIKYRSYILILNNIVRRLVLLLLVDILNIFGARFSKNLRKILRKSQEVLKTYENLRKNLRQCWFSKNLKRNLGKTYDHCKAVLGNCKIDYTVVFFYVNHRYIFYR